jgi:hypothetical protein
MRILSVLLLVMFFAAKANSQGTVVLFSENGEKFTAYINGSPRNDKPASRVETDRPGGPTFKVRIHFEDSAIPEIAKSIFNSPGDEMFYVLRPTGKGKFIMEKTSSEYVHHKDSGVKEESGTKKETKATEKSSTKPSGGGGKGCSQPMSEPDFIASREMISNAPFDGPKLSHAKSLADKHCLTTSQIIDVIYIFSGEASRLTFAKHAYKSCYDPANYDKVKDVLRKSSQDDLQRYIDLQK